MERHAVNDDPTALIHGYLDGELTADQRRQLIVWLGDDASHVDHFVAECRLHSELFDTQGVGSAVQLPNQPGNHQSAIDNQQSSIPPIILDLSTTVDRSPLANLFSPNGFVFPYVVSALIVGISLLIGWTWTIHYDHQVVRDVPRQAPGAGAPETPLVGRVTGAVDCRWADPTAEVCEHGGVPLGGKYAPAFRVPGDHL